LSRIARCGAEGEVWRGKIEEKKAVQTEIQTEVQSLYQISQIAAKAKNLDALWQPLFDEISKIMQVDAGTLMILEDDELVRKTAKGLGDNIMKEPPIPRSKGGVSWKAVTTRDEVVINDLSASDIASQALKEGEFHSLMTVPMMVREQVIGVISIFARKGRNFSDSDVSMFRAIANQAALAIISLTSAEFLKENKKRLAELSALNQISRSVATLFDFEETLFSIIGLITKQLRGDQGVIVLFDHKEKLLKAALPAFNLTPSQVRDFRTRTDEGATGQAFCKGIPINIETIDQETKETLERAKITGVKSMLVAPLKVKSQTLGVIHVFSSKEKNFTADDLKLFNILTSSAAVVVNSSYIYQKIEEEKKKDDALLSSIGEGVLAVNDNRDIILLNAAGERITGFLQEELLGKSVESTLQILNDKKVMISREESPIAKVLTDGKPIFMNNVFLKRHDGVLFPARFNVAATHDAMDKIIGAIVVFNDITHDLEVERMKQELISIATHELRTPITGIKGYLEMILDGDTGGVNKETKEVLDEMSAINGRIADLVDDLLNIGRIEQGRIEIKPKPTNLIVLIYNCIKELSVQAKEKNLELIFNPPTDIPQILADPDRTKQILVNLIGNAIKYTPEGKKSKVEDWNEIEITLDKKGKDIVCHVKDHGLGISKEGQKQLFQKFSRVKTDQTRMITGTGLGLWITKQIVEMMSGKIWVESVEGKGSTFSFTLPQNSV